MAYTQPTVLPPSNGAPCTQNLTLSITTDDNDSETSWEIRRFADNSVTASGGGYADVVGANVIVENICLPVDDYRLYVMDAGGNGISGGGYVLADQNGRRIIDANGMFTSTSAVQLPFSLPLSNMTMQPISCDRTDVKPNTTLYALTQPGAQGYQFWFFDPHGSYSRRIFRTQKTVRPNQIVTFPLPVGMDLNVKVRVKVANVFSAFGAACRIRLMVMPRSPEQILPVSTSLLLYPNPNAGDRVCLLMEDLSGDAQRVEVDIFDAIGRQVHTEVIQNTGSSLNTELRITERLNTGAYSVRVTVDGASRTTRLMIM